MNRRGFFAAPLALFPLPAPAGSTVSVEVLGDVISNQEFVNTVLIPALNEAVARRDVIIVNNERVQL